VILNAGQQKLLPNQIIPGGGAVFIIRRTTITSGGSLALSGPGRLLLLMAGLGLFFHLSVRALTPRGLLPSAYDFCA
jgi:hypothetical protein